MCALNLFDSLFHLFLRLSENIIDSMKLLASEVSMLYTDTPQPIDRGRFAGGGEETDVAHVLQLCGVESPYFFCWGGRVPVRPALGEAKGARLFEAFMVGASIGLAPVAPTTGYAHGMRDDVDRPTGPLISGDLRPSIAHAALLKPVRRV